MTTLSGQYFDGIRPIALPAVVRIEDDAVTLTVGEREDRFASRALLVSPRVGSAARFITLPDGGQFQCADHPALDALAQESPTERPVAWLEARWGVALAGVVITMSLLVGVYLFGLPAAAAFITERIPARTERALGLQAVDWLDENKFFQRSRLDRNTRQGISRDFDKLTDGLRRSTQLQLEFRSSVAGANAFTFPGGVIVLTDDMVLAAGSREEVLAVLAHEIGHVEQRHTLRIVLQSSGVALIATAITSDAATLSGAVAGLPMLLVQAKYSRKFEEEADRSAFRMLKRTGHSPEAFATLMDRLAARRDAGERAFPYLTSHPVTEDRVQQAREAAEPGH